MEADGFDSSAKTLDGSSSTVRHSDSERTLAVDADGFDSSARTLDGSSSGLRRSDSERTVAVEADGFDSSAVTLDSSSDISRSSDSERTLAVNADGFDSSAVTLDGSAEETGPSAETTTSGTVTAEGTVAGLDTMAPADGTVAGIDTVAPVGGTVGGLETVAPVDSVGPAETVAGLDTMAPSSVVVTRSGSAPSESGVSRRSSSDSGLTDAPEKAFFGQVLGDATLSGLLGKGAMGAVYRATRPDGGVVAVKVILPDRSVLEAARQRFRQEAKVNLALGRHPNIVGCLGSGEDPFPWIQFEFVSGQSLRQVLVAEKRLEPAVAIRHMIEVLKGLEHAHGRAVLHRDLKPDNIMLSDEGRVALADFGIGRVHDEAEDDSERLTLTGQPMGTPYYVAPEQIRSAKSVDARADLYSIGAMLYHLIAGRPPFTGNAKQVMRRHLNEAPRRLGAWVDDLPEAVDGLVQRLMAKSPEERPASATALREELQSLLGALELQTPEQTLADQIAVSEGRQIGGWLLEDELGAGGMGKVFRARRGEQVAALKILQASTLQDTSRQRFEREIGVTTQLDHPNIIEVLDTGVEAIEGGECPYMVMELVDSDLKQRLKAAVRFSPAEAVAVTIGAGKALAHAHAHEIVHRDIKPENLLIRGDRLEESAVRVADFGVATFSHRSGDLTRTGAVGTFDYMAPEQAKGVENIDGRADVYSLGATLYRLVTGTKVFDAKTLQESVRMHDEVLPELASKQDSRVDDTLALLIDFALLKRVEDRPAMAEWVGDLGAYASHSLSQERLREIRARVRAGRRHFEPGRPKLWASLFAAALVLLLALIVSSRQAPDPYLTARDNLSALRDKAEGLKGASASRELIDSCRVLLDSLDRSIKAGEGSGEPVPDELRAERDRVRTILSRSSLALLERLAGELLEAPDSADAAARRGAIAEIRSSLVTALPGSPEETDRAFRRRLDQIEDQLGEAKSAGAILTALGRFREQVRSKQWERALATLESKADSGPRRALERFSENFGKRSTVYRRAARELDELEKEARAALASLDAELAKLEQRRRGAEDFKAFQDEVGTFLKTIPAGNPKRLERATELTRQEDPEQLAARFLLKTLKARLAEGEPASWDYPSLLGDLKTLRSKYGRFKEAEEAGQLERQIRDACAKASQEALAAFEEKLRLTLEAGVDPAGYDECVDALASWPPASAARFRAWPGLEKDRGERVERLKSERGDYPRRLTAAMIKALDERAPGKRFDRVKPGEMPGSAAFAARLRRVEAMAAGLRRWPESDDALPGEARTKALKLVARTVPALLALHSTLVSIPGGSFELGHDDELFDHSPQHTVTLSAFLIDRSEVSVSAYRLFLEHEQRVLGAEQHRPLDWEAQLAEPRLPVRGVSLEDARAFAAWAGKRLPSEPEWEAAARRSGGPYPWGAEEPDSLRACFEQVGGAPVAVESPDYNRGRTPDGLFHMAGNVEEWTASPFKIYPGGKARAVEAGTRVVRGGHYESDGFVLQVWRRTPAKPGRRDALLGFRCAASP